MGDTETYTLLASGPMHIRYDHSRWGTTAEWTLCAGLIPTRGQVCKDTTLHTVKVGDGTTTYGVLPTVDSADPALDGGVL